MTKIFLPFLQKRSLLLRWIMGIWIGNTVVFWLIAINYLKIVLPLRLFYLSSYMFSSYITRISLFGKAIVYLFFFATYFSYFAILALLPSLMVIIIIILFFPQRYLFFTASIILNACAILLLYADTYVFTLYRFHLNSMILEMTFSGGAGHAVLDFSTMESLIFIGLSGIILLIEIVITYAAWKWSTLKKYWSWIKRFIITLSCAFIFSLLILILGTSVGISQFIKQTLVFPAYDQLLQLIFTPQQVANFRRITDTRYSELQQPNKPINYPLRSLQCNPIKTLPNIFIIGIDAWRFDNVTPQITPNIFAFSQDAIWFTQHMSGGNATQPGLFSLFYAIPSNYWTAMEQQQVGPVLIDLLQKYHYQIGVFASANLYVPPLYKNIFVNVKHLMRATDGDHAAARDRNITKEFQQFLQTSAKPKFAFLFYDAAHAYCTLQDYSQPFQPAIKECNRLTLNNNTDPLPYLNRYRNALHFIDGEVARVLKTIKTQGLWDDSIIIITSDHGQEFNDNHNNYWEHTSNFTRYQIQVPLLIHWPNKKPQKINYSTSHYDVVPTLLQNVFQCNNPLEDYSIGKNLFTPEEFNFLIVGSYDHMGIIEKTRITELLTTGEIKIEDVHATEENNYRPNSEILQKILEIMQKYFKK